MGVAGRGSGRILLVTLMDAPWVIDPAKMSKLDGLSPEQQTVLSLVLDARKTYGEAAQILGVSESVVRERAHEAIDNLANNPARVPPPPPVQEDHPPADPNPSLKGGLLIGLVLGGIAAAIILISSGGGKSSAPGRSVSTRAARVAPTTRFIAPASRKFVPSPTTKSIAPVTSRPVSPVKAKPITPTAKTATPTVAAKKPAGVSKPAATKPAASATSFLSLAANPNGGLKYDTKSLTAATGKVSIDFTNISPITHNVTVANSTGTVIGRTPTFKGKSKTLELTLKPGTYTFYCSLPGHRMAGMQGTLSVR
jgi:plastocyanin